MSGLNDFLPRLMPTCKSCVLACTSRCWFIVLVLSSGLLLLSFSSTKLLNIKASFNHPSLTPPSFAREYIRITLVCGNHSSFYLPAYLPAVYNFLVQQWMGYKAAVAAAGGTASAGVGVTEAALINRALSLLSKILPWVGEKTMEDDSHDFLPVSIVPYRNIPYRTVPFRNVRHGNETISTVQYHVAHIDNGGRDQYHVTVTITVAVTAPWAR